MCDRQILRGEVGSRELCSGDGVDGYGGQGRQGRLHDGGEDEYAVARIPGDGHGAEQQGSWRIPRGYARDHRPDVYGGARQHAATQERVRRLQSGRTHISGTVLSVFLGPPRDVYTSPA